MRERVLVIGGGFIGRTVVRSLAAAGRWEVALATRSPVRTEPAVTVFAGFDADLAQTAPETLRRVRDFDPDVVVQAYGKGLSHADDAREATLANGVYPVEVGHWLRRHTRCRCIVHVGTCFEYGHAREGERLGEDAALCPFNLYGASKIVARFGLEELASTTEVQVVYLVAFFLFGPGEAPSRLSPTIFEAVLAGAPTHFSDGRQARDFVYADDLGAVVARVLERRGALPQWTVFNVCSGQGLSVRDFVLLTVTVVEKRFGTRPPDVHFDRARKWRNEPEAVVGDPSRARQVLGWECQWDLKTAIEEYFAWYSQQHTTAATARR
jgi:nucleoside-diphosphate-sugar epimerase